MLFLSRKIGQCITIRWNDDRATGEIIVRLGESSASGAVIGIDAPPEYSIDLTETIPKGRNPQDSAQYP